MPKPKSKNRTKPTATPIYVDGRTMASMLGVSKDTLKTWRLGDRRGKPATLKEGIHWVRLGLRDTRYHVALMCDYMATRHAPQHHQKAIEAYLAGLPSSRAVE